MKRFIAALVMAGAAGAIVLAPVADAAPTGTRTTDTGGATVVESPGNVQITAQPGAAAVQAGELQYPFFGYGWPGTGYRHGYHHRSHR